MINTKIILKNAFSNGSAFFVEAVTAFVMMPFIVHRIGDSAYGIWLLINAVSGYMNFFKLGLRPAVNKHVAQYKALEEFDSLRSFIEAGFFIYLICSVVIIIATAGIYLVVADIFQIPPQYVTVVKNIVLLVGIQTAFGLLGTLFGGVISGYQRYDINAGIEICVISIRALLIFVFLPYFPDIYTVAAAHFSLTILGYIVTIFFAKKIAHLSNLHLFRKPSKESLSTIFKFSAVSIGVSGIGILALYSDNILVGAILSTAAITHYSVGGRLVKYSNNLLQVLSHVIAPATSELKAKNEDGAIAILLEYTVKVSCFIAFPILLCLMIQGNDFILLWMGEGYEKSYKVLLILATAAFLILPQQIINPILYGLAKHHFLLYVSAIEVVLAFGIGYFCGKYYGVLGIAFGFSFPRAILRGIIFPIFIYKKIGVKLSRIVINCYVRVGLAALPFAITLYFFAHGQFLKSWFAFCLQLLLSIAIYLVSCWCIAFSGSERKHVILKLNNYVPLLWSRFR